jgi:glycosyltransferase involved in cell wall biosynthesis
MGASVIRLRAWHASTDLACTRHLTAAPATDKIPMKAARANKATRVLMVVENRPYASDPRVQNEARTLLERGYRVSVICPAKGREPFHMIEAGVSIYRFPDPHFRRHVLEYSYALLAMTVLTVVALLNEGFDVIHLANPPDFVAFFAGWKIFGKRIIYDQHDLCPELYVVKFGDNQLTKRALLWLEKLAYRLADHVIVTNQSYKDIALERGGISESRLTIVRNGPNLQAPTSANIGPELRRKASAIIVYAGAIATQDGVEYLCRALHHLYHTVGHKDFHCVIIGSGECLQVVKDLAREVQVDERVSFIGWISDPGLYASYLASADICVAPEPQNEYNNKSTFIKILEYMAAGKAVVAFDLAESRRSAEGAALYARPNDVQDFAKKLAILISNPSLRRSMGQCGPLRVSRQLAWRYSAPELLAAYDKVLGNSWSAVPPPVGERRNLKTDTNASNGSSHAQKAGQRV